ncbi:hypothetical protein [Runella sp.]|uniref:hypothetical protein n=1 Tax=Runella sp. TaxID=1960881 RepID=UPI003D0AC551
MNIHLTVKFSIAFVALLFVMSEAHEIVHITVGRLLCGCWGARDFNVWGLCEECASPYALFATFAGPLFTFGMLWIGAFYLKKTKSEQQKSFGYALIFANMPFARLFQPLTGGGDEVWALTRLLHNHGLAQVIGFIGIFIITFFPLYRAYSIVKNKNRALYFILFFLLPVLLVHLVLLGGMNSLLKHGVLSNYWLMGTPVLITVWTLIMLTVFLLFRKSIFTLSVTGFQDLQGD